METADTESFTTQTEQMQNANKKESAEKFQKFIYELFDKNGILGDLRAYLRGHIVNVLRSAQNGDLPSCQKNFTQRLEPKFQALNMLVTEYLLCMEFSYSLSVFISEIPLANMVFGFAKLLMEGGAEDNVRQVRFKDHDVWSILNYLGIKCDSEHASNVVEMYKTQTDLPLLLCIFKCIKLHNPEVNYPGANSQDGSISSISKSSESEPYHRARHEKCKHFAFCRICHARFIRLREKYRKKKRNFCKMFEEQKTVYEAEADMLKNETEEQIKRSLTSHAIHFQQRQCELEETFKAREAALEGNIEHKKRFLWGLAKALRTQHAQMTGAMQAVRAETKRLAEREQSLKAQLAEAEEMLKQRGEDMRKQIAEELAMLEEHLESMKSERDSLNRERVELDTRKSQSDNKIVNVKVENNMKNHYELLKEELVLIKNYLEGNKEPKSTERGTITDVSNVNSRINVVMNNEMGMGVKEEVKPAQLVNDLKKPKNVNFSQSQTNVMVSPGPRSRSPSPNSTATIRSLIADNERLRRTATQQSAQIAELAARAARMHAALRPRTAPAALPHGLARPNASFGWCKGGGEELTLLGPQPAPAPGEPQPFVGIGGERRTDNRRHLINQWRAMRRRMTPLASGSRSRTERMRSNSKEQEDDGGVSSDSPPRTHREMENRPREDIVVFQAMSVTRPSTTREKSPCATLREAKLRLRKLEIEAAAVERSYMDFRRRRERRKSDNASDATSLLQTTAQDHNADNGPENSEQTAAPLRTKIDLEKFLTRYQNDLDIGQSHFKNKNTAAEVIKPIPEVFSEVNKNMHAAKQDYLAKPLSEFRKFYYSKSDRQAEESFLDSQLDTSSPDNQREELQDRLSEIEKATHAKERELEILEQNLSKIYNLQDEPTKEIDDRSSKKTKGDDDHDNNLLRVEIEATENENDVLLVESSVDSRAMSRKESCNDRLSPQMTIIVSPKDLEKKHEKSERSSPSEQEPHLTRKDVINAILNAAKDSLSNDLPLPLEAGNDQDSVIDQDEYADDFSADVDNYNSKAETDRDMDSRVSLPKTSEDEFWD